MNATSVHPAEGTPNPTTGATDNQKVLVWDAPVRVFHWLMVLCFVGAYTTSESETWRLVHVTLGYTMAGLVVFRLIWGLIGTRHARFASFVRGPQAVAQYLRSLLGHDPAHHTGHNPAGAVAIVGILALSALVAATGWAAYSDVAGEWVAELHEVVANGMLMLVGIHLAGVVISSWLHQENLARAMVTGRKSAPRAQGIRGASRTTAIVLLVAVLGFWYVQWHSAPTDGRIAGVNVLSHASATTQASWLHALFQYDPVSASMQAVAAASGASTGWNTNSFGDMNKWFGALMADSFA